MNVHSEQQPNLAGPAIEFSASPTGVGSRLKTCQLLPHRRDQVFAVFSDVFRLQALTPAWLHFSVLTPAPVTIREGTLIDYRLRLRGLPIRWQSCISEWNPPLGFVDVQVRGPYRSWRHEHIFEATDGGTVCRDIVDYAVPGGRLIDWLFVRRDLREIFEYRHRKLAELFPATACDSPDEQTKLSFSSTIVFRDGPQSLGSDACTR